MRRCKLDSKELGHQIRKRRREKGISQETLAMRVGISRQYVSYIESGKAQNVSINILYQLASALETTPTELTVQSNYDAVLISPILREFALEEELGFDIVDRLSRIPKRGQEPQTVEEWRKLYEAIREYLE